GEGRGGDERDVGGRRRAEEKEAEESDLLRRQNISSANLAFHRASRRRVQQQRSKGDSGATASATDPSPNSDLGQRGVRRSVDGGECSQGGTISAASSSNNGA